MRLFLAVDLPESLRADLGRLSERLRARSTGWRWTRPEGVHLTLRFLGEVDPARVPELASSFRGAAGAARPFVAEVGGLGTFPPRGAPRVLWVGVSEPSGALVALAAWIEERARAAGFEPETRPYSPHLTLARAAAGERPGRPVEQVGAVGSLPGDAVCLFRSILGRGGARYDVLERMPLGLP